MEEKRNAFGFSSWPSFWGRGGRRGIRQITSPWSFVSFLSHSSFSRSHHPLFNILSILGIYGGTVQRCRVLLLFCSNYLSTWNVECLLLLFVRDAIKLLFLFIILLKSECGKIFYFCLIILLKWKIFIVCALQCNL